MTDRMQLAKECAEVEKLGGSVRDYLTCCGCISPWGTWYRLQKEELGRKEDKITDGKGGDDVRKLTLEDKKKAVQIAMEGGNPLKFLKDFGVGNPSATWLYIKKCLKARDPEQYEQMVKAMEPEEPAKDDKPVAKDEKPVILKPEILEKIAEETVAEDDISVYGVHTAVGDFMAAGGKLCWYVGDPNEAVNFPVEKWKSLMGVLPRVMKMMGLE